MTDVLPSRRVLLLGDAGARPAGLERALARGGYHPVEPEGEGLEHPPATPPDLVLISASHADERLGRALAALTGEAWRAIPRVVLLSDRDAEGAARALTMGADDAMVAPVHLPELIARLVARLRHGPEDSEHHAAAWRQELMFDILEELSTGLRSDAIVETLVRRVGLALELSRCSFLLAAPGERYGRVIAVLEHPGTRDLR
ncbi:MAG TPA: hypothetical protein VLD58_10290, partial [Gemmatimonadales bacterium]|nr:hypothetical protein [Gemmatimonadales bacterium]